MIIVLPRLVLVFGFFLASFSLDWVLGQTNDAAAICSARFARFDPKHTACVKPNQECKINKSGVSKQEQQIIVNVHNYYRNLIASGNESRLGFGPASDMLTMEWDSELAYVAQKHAEQCNFEHDCYDCRRTERFPVIGQNLYLYRTTRSSVDTQWKYVIKEWYDEIQIAPPVVATNFDLFDLNIGHFTQIAWAKTNRVGCGFTTFENNESGDNENSIFKTIQLYTCNYAPGGNFLNEKMYQNGTGASQCPPKWARSKQFSSLCQYVRKRSNRKKTNKKKKSKKSKPKPRTSRVPTFQDSLVFNNQAPVSNSPITIAIPITSTTTTTTTTTTVKPIVNTREIQHFSIPTTTVRPIIRWNSNQESTTTTTSTVKPIPQNVPSWSNVWQNRAQQPSGQSATTTTTRQPWWAAYKTTRKPTWRYVNNFHTTQATINNNNFNQANRIDRRNV